MNLSRRSREEDRADRLAQWKDAFSELHQLPEDERSAVQTLFSGSIASNPPPTRVAVKEVLSDNPTFDDLEMEPALDRITSLIDDLSNLRLAYEGRSTTSSSRARPDALTQALQHVSELEMLYETVPETMKKDLVRSPPEEEKTSVLDEKLEEVIPEEAFRESKRQRMMTEEEGEIISSILGLPISDSTSSSTSTGESSPTEDREVTGKQLTTPRSSSHGQSSPPATSPGLSELDKASGYGSQTPSDELDTDLGSVSMDPMDRLDELIRTSPEIKQIYERRLAMPTSLDHDACMELVARMGIPVIKAAIPYEAEGLAASLARAGLVDFVGTEDSDVIAYEVCSLFHISYQ